MGFTRRAFVGLLPAALAVVAGCLLQLQTPTGYALSAPAPGTIATFAGGGPGDGVLATSAVLKPWGLAVDAGGNAVIVDGVNCQVRKITAGVISTVAGSGVCLTGGDGGPPLLASFWHPSGVAIDATGALYIAETEACRVRKVSGGIVTSVAGGVNCNANNFSGDGGPATLAGVSHLTGLAVDAGAIYIADNENCRIRRVAGGIITTVAGNGVCGFGGDGAIATSAMLNLPRGVAVDSVGDLYIADTYNCRVRRVTGSVITTIAGTGTCGFSGDGGAATSAQLYRPDTLLVDPAGRVFISDSYNCRVRVVSGGVISTVAGAGTCGYGGDPGSATAAQLHFPRGLALDGNGNLLIADTGNCRVRKVEGSTITTIAGTGECTYAGDGGPATSAVLDAPTGLAVDSVGSVYITDTLNCRVRKVVGGVIANVAGNGMCGYGGDGGPATSASVNWPQAVAVDGSGAIYIADTGNCRVRRVAGGTITTIAGTGACGYNGDGIVATSARISQPVGVAVDGVGNVFISDACGVREVSGGLITSVATTGGPICGSAVLPSVNDPRGLAVAADGSLYIAEGLGCAVEKLSAGVLTRIAGVGGYYSCTSLGDGGPAMTAGLNYPVGVTVDIAENVYISEWTGGRVRKVSGGVISTIAGNGTCCFSGDGGAATSAALWGPFAIGVDGDGNLYVVDYWANRVRVVYGVASVPLDSDGDGYPDALEITLGKNPNVYCPVMRADVDGDGVVSILDLRAAAQVFGRSVPPAPSRYDQGAPSVRDGSVNILDLSMMGFQFAKHVSSCP